MHMAALEVRLEPGWKTYWRAPGDAGIPPSFDWRRSRNLADVELVWPTPTISLQGGVRTIGYRDVLILPMRVVPAREGGEVGLSGRIEMGVCKDVCVPIEMRVSQRLSGDNRTPDARIVAALVSRPYSADEAEVGRVACRLSQVGDSLALRAEIDMPGMGGQETAIIEVDDPQIWVAPASTTRQGGRLVAQTRLYHAEGQSFALNRSGIRITVLGQSRLGQSRAVDIHGCPAG